MLAPFKFTNLTKALVRGAPSASKRVADILRSYGTDAHLWLPGVGALNGIEAANFIESIGTSAAAVDGPVGYVGDAGKTLGPELIPDGGMDSTGHFGSTSGTGFNTSWQVSGGVFRLTSTQPSVGNSTRSYPVQAGATYRVSGRLRNVSATNARVVVQNGNSPYTSLAVSPLVPGTEWVSFYGVFTAISGSIQLILQITPTAVGQVVEFDDLSIAEIVGAIPATQSTTASKPILRRGHVNRILQSGWTGGTGGTVGSGAVAPTGWVFINTGGSVTYQPAASGLGNSIRFTAAGTRPAIGQSFTVLAGMTYTISYMVEAVHSGAVSIENLLNPGAIPAGASLSYKLNGVTVPGSTNVVAGLIQITVAVGATGGVMQPRFGPGVGTTATVDITCSNPQLETGSTANTYVPTTTAAASSPTGPMYWEMDGTDDRLQLSAVPFQQADDHCVIVGSSNQKAAGAGIVFSITGSGVARLAQMAYINGVLTPAYVDDAGANGLGAGVAVSIGSVNVSSVRKVGNQREFRVNGVQIQLAGVALGTTTVTDARFGAHQATATNFHLGNIYPAAIIKGTVSDTDRDTLTRWIGSLSGVTIP